MSELDFSGKQVLVVGGSSGIGNGVAQAFRAKGARVHVCGTRARAADYSPAEGSQPCAYRKSFSAGVRGSPAATGTGSRASQQRWTRPSRGGSGGGMAW